jgi:hypothetical protein
MGLEILYGIGAVLLLVALVWGANRYRNPPARRAQGSVVRRAHQVICGGYPVLANNPKPANAIRRQAKDSATTRIIRYRILMKVLSGSLRGALTRC